MFTGLVAEVGEVRSLAQTPAGARLELRAALAAELERGGSVAVDGACLTAARVEGGGFAADVMAETLALTSLGALEPGDRVNLELALRAADRLGGHFVQGHVDGVGRVESIVAEGFARRVRIAAGPEVCRYVAHKGSVAVAGVSLTAIDPTGDDLTVALIPETLERTTLGRLEPGDHVNLEVDLLAKYVERLTGGADLVEDAV